MVAPSLDNYPPANHAPSRSLETLRSDVTDTPKKIVAAESLQLELVNITRTAT